MPSFGSSAPVEWTMQLNSLPLRVIHILCMIFSLLVFLSLILAGTAVDGAVVTSGSFVLHCGGLIILRQTRDRNNEAKVHAVLLFVAHAFYVYSDAFIQDDIRRHRGLVRNFMMWRAVMIVFPFPRAMSYVLLTLLTVNDVVAHMMADSMHKVSMQGSPYWNMVVFSILCVPTFELTTQRSRMLYDAQEKLTLDKSLLQKLMAMLCDGSMTIGQDKDTILSSNGGFDHLMARSMKGESLMKYLPENEKHEERERVAQAFARAQKEPVLIPTTLTCKETAATNVELFIVHHGAMFESENTTLQTTYLVGIKTVLQVERSEDDDFHIDEPSGGFSAHDAHDNEAEPHRDDETILSVQNSLPSTNTGVVFTMLNQTMRDLQAGSTSHRQMQLTLQKLINLGKREHWFIDMAYVHVKPGLKLGSGGFGSVLGADMYGMNVALKIAKHTSAACRRRAFESLSTELRVLRHVRHPNIVLFHGSTINSTTCEIALVLERVYGQKLDAFLTHQ